jgi:predicted nucleotidyltransferase
MIKDFKNSLLTVCKTLEKFDVKYMLIGGTAVALNGYFRLSMNISGELTDKPDIDIWYNPTYENYFNILKVVEDLGQDITEFKNEKSPNPRKSFFKLDFENFTLDILPEIKSDIKFNEVYQRKETIEIDSVQFHFMNYLDLIEDKKATARSKDLKDIEELKKVNNGI